MHLGGALISRDPPPWPTARRRRVERRFLPNTGRRVGRRWTATPAPNAVCWAPARSVSHCQAMARRASACREVTYHPHAPGRSPHRAPRGGGGKRRVWPTPRPFRPIRRRRLRGPPRRFFFFGRAPGSCRGAAGPTELARLQERWGVRACRAPSPPHPAHVRSPPVLFPARCRLLARGASVIPRRPWVARAASASSVSLHPRAPWLLCPCRWLGSPRGSTAGRP